jgi:endonuclease III
MKIENTKYIRDENSKAILNTNRNALESYKTARNIKLNENKKLNDCIDDINILKSELSEIKNILKFLIEKSHG